MPGAPTSVQDVTAGLVEVGYLPSESAALVSYLLTGDAVFVTAAIMDVIAAVMAVAVLKPMLKAHIARA